MIFPSRILIAINIPDGPQAASLYNHTQVAMQLTLQPLHKIKQKFINKSAQNSNETKFPRYDERRKHET